VIVILSKNIQFINMHPKKTVRERAEEAAFSEVLSGDYIRMMKLDPLSANKYLADQAAGDVQKYSPMGGKYGGLENTLNSPITPMNRCRFCESEEQGGKKLLRCSACKAVRYCDRDCQSKDWPFHKKGCALIRSDPKGLGDKMILSSS